MIICKRLDSKEKRQCEAFRELMRAYSQEIDSHLGETTPAEMLTRWTQSVIEKGSVSKDRFLFLAWQEQKAVGFFYGKIDREGDSGDPRPGWGYVMEFYVAKQFRRTGIGTAMYNEMETLFRRGGAGCFYLTADPVSGVPFWLAMGFSGTGIISPENQQEIYEKKTKMSQPQRPDCCI